MTWVHLWIRSKLDKQPNTMDLISFHKILEWVRNNFFASKICYLCVIERFSFLLNCLTRSPFDPYVCLLVIFTSSDETLHWTWTVGGLLFWNVWICGFNKLWICGMPQMWAAAVLSAVSSQGVELFHMCTKWRRNANPVLLDFKTQHFPSRNQIG